MSWVALRSAIENKNESKIKRTGNKIVISTKIETN